MSRLTDELVDRFAVAMKAKLNAVDVKYGYCDDWLLSDWRDDLIRDMQEHISKGDPIDVAAYCAFAWHHGWSIAPKDIRIWNGTEFVPPAMGGHRRPLEWPWVTISEWLNRRDQEDDPDGRQD